MSQIQRRKKKKMENRTENVCIREREYNGAFVYRVAMEK